MNFNKIFPLLLLLLINFIFTSISLRISSNVNFTLNKLVTKLSIIQSSEYLKRINWFHTPFHTLPLEVIFSSHPLSPYVGTKLTTNKKLLEISKCNICEAIVEAATIEFNHEGEYLYLMAFIENDIYYIISF